LQFPKASQQHSPQLLPTLQRVQMQIGKWVQGCMDGVRRLKTKLHPGFCATVALIDNPSTELSQWEVISYPKSIHSWIDLRGFSCKCLCEFLSSNSSVKLQGTYNLPSLGS
jgi:hypothetical protein